MKNNDNANNQTNGDPEIRPVKVALKVEKNRDGKLGKTEIYLDYSRSRMMTKEEYQKQCEAAMEF
jgi:hypothetical protein